MGAAPAGTVTHAIAQRRTQILPERFAMTPPPDLRVTSSGPWASSRAPPREGQANGAGLRRGLPRALEEHRRPGELLVTFAPPDLRGHGDVITARGKEAAPEDGDAPVTAGERVDRLAGIRRPRIGDR